MNTITLPFNWIDHQNQERYVTSLEGITVDLLTLTKVDLNNKLDYDGNVIRFKSEQVVKRNSLLSVSEFLQDNPLRLSGVGIFKSHCVIKGFNDKEEVLDGRFTDNFFGANVVKNISLKTFGYSPIEIIKLIESTGVIKRACRNAFIVLNKELFYKWMGEEFMTGELFFEYLKKSLTKI